MKNWFDNFESCLKGAKASADLIGAGTADSNRAMSHYRYQQQAKMKEAVELTFPVLLKYLGDEWESNWQIFWNQNEISPRSLDWFPEVFLNFFMTTSYPVWMKELARFEHRMDVHPWSHQSLSLKPHLTLDENSRIELGNYEFISFSAPVTGLYEDSEGDKISSENVLLWQKESGVFYRAMKDWERKVFENLSLGVGEALEHAPDDPEAVGEFLKWLGSSCLIQGLKQD